MILAKWLVGFGIAGYLLTILEVSDFKAAIFRADLRFLAAGTLVVFAARLLYAWQVALAVRHHGIPLTTMRALVINTIAGFYGLFLPGGLSAGVIKWYKLAKPSGNRAEVLAAILFLRLINTSVILGFGMVGVLVDNPLDSSLLFWTALCLFVTLAAVCMGFVSKRVAVRFEVIRKHDRVRIRATIRDWLRKVLTSFAQYRTLSHNHLLKVLVVPFMNQVLTIILFLAVARALSISIPLSALVWIWSVVYIIQLIPASISGLGLRESALVFLLPHYGVEPASAMAFSLTIFGYTVLAGLIGGILEAGEVLFNPLYRQLRTKGAVDC